MKMRRFFRFLVLSSVFLAGYYVGHLPGSPDIFAEAADFYRSVHRAGDEISSRAEEEDIPLTEATLSWLLDPPAGAGEPRD